MQQEGDRLASSVCNLSIWGGEMGYSPDLACFRF